MNVRAFGVRCMLFFFVCALFFNVTPQIHVEQGRLSASYTIPQAEAESLVRGIAGTAVRMSAGSSWFLGLFKSSATKAIIQQTVAVLMVVIGFIAWLLSFISAIALFFAAAILDAAVALSTTGLSDIVNGSGRDAIDQTWRIFRDLANIGFVFVLLYVAITFILSADSSSTKKMLSNTIIAAFLVNFSFFFAALVVDVSNQMAIAVNDKIEELIGDESISSFISKKTEIHSTTQALGVTQDHVESQDDGASGKESLREASQKWPTEPDAMIQWGTGMILTVILHLVLAIVLLIGAFMFISRTLIIILLLITSPIGFVGRILPITQKLGREWWQSLVGNAFALPVFFLFIYVAFKLIDGGILNVVPNAGAAPSATASYAEILVPSLIAPLLKYGIVIGFFIGALSAAKKMNSMGITVVSKLSGQITSTLGKRAMGTAGFAGRNTVGWAANKIGKNEWVQDKLANRGFGMGNLALKGMSGVANSSFDARASRTFSGVASATGVGDTLGKSGGKGGFAQQLKDSDEKRVKFATDVLTQSTAAAEKERLDKEVSGAAGAQKLLDKAKAGGDPVKIQQAEQRVANAEKRVTERKEQYAAAQNKRKLDYANNISNPSTGALKAAKWVRDTQGSAGRSAIVGAKIKKEISKSKTDQLLEALIKVEKDQIANDKRMNKDD